MIIFVHGIRSKGTDNVDRMGDKLEARGHWTVDFDYPTVNLLDVLLKMRGFHTKTVMQNASRLCQVTQGADQRPDAVAHSMGCLVTLRAMECGAKFGTVFWFAPAMNKDFVIPNWGCERLYIIHNRNDKAIKLGSVLRMHPFGDMGLVGSQYEGLDWRIKNIEPAVKGQEWFSHNYAFEGDELDYWTDFVETKI